MARGLAGSGRTITSAALIMIAVFLAACYRGGAQRPTLDPPLGSAWRWEAAIGGGTKDSSNADVSPASAVRWSSHSLGGSAASKTPATIAAIE
ncbi:hypothetical protein [Nocardioides sp.]|uniref:hypothetical protein n=1 Tax=Nocardioides sp. TaxID=35761 RepID=UPI0026257EE5|nr:hypothetical protein [Nocardioides sp.]